jgi:MMP 1-O-methyltransferase
MQYVEQLPDWFRKDGDFSGAVAAQLTNISAIADRTHGWLTRAQGIGLYQMAARKMRGTCLEIGSFYGKSTLFLGLGCKHSRSECYAVDPHKALHEGGKEQFGPDLKPCAEGSLIGFRRTLAVADLQAWVKPIVATSVDARPGLAHLELKVLFIDGSHDFTDVLLDYLLWQDLVLLDGYLVFHDSNFDTVKRILGEYIDRRRFEYAGTIGNGPMAMSIWKRTI